MRGQMVLACTEARRVAHLDRQCQLGIDTVGGLVALLWRHCVGVLAVIPVVAGLKCVDCRKCLEVEFREVVCGVRHGPSSAKR